MQSFKHIEQKLAEEPWIDMDYHQPTVRMLIHLFVFIICAVHINFIFWHIFVNANELIKILWM